MIKKINTFFILTIFFLIPLIFSHFHYLFGFNYNFEFIYSYERLKVSSFLILFSLLFIFTLIDFNKIICFFKSKFNKNIFYLSLILFISIFISTFFSGNIIFSLLGSNYSLHGGIYYFSLFIFSLILIYNLGTYSNFNRYILFYIFSSFFIVFLYGIIQFLGFDPISNYISRVPLDRIFSTFGNANYLAGYSLILLPFSLYFFRNNYIKYLFFSLIFILLLLTKSLIGITLGFFYLMFLIYKKINITYSKYFILFFLLLFIIIFYNFFIEYNLDWMKLKGFIARFYLWKSFFIGSFDSVFTFFFGHGADSMFIYYNKYKDSMLNIYEDSNFVANSSHNFFIDIFFQFGTIGFLSFFTIIFLILKKNYGGFVFHSIILFLIFFSFNIHISAHLIVFVYSLSLLSIKKNN